MASFDLEDLFLTFQETSVKFFEEWDPSPLNERGRDFVPEMFVEWHLYQE